MAEVVVVSSPSCFTWIHDQTRPDTTAVEGEGFRQGILNTTGTIEVGRVDGVAAVTFDAVLLMAFPFLHVPTASSLASFITWVSRLRVGGRCDWKRVRNSFVIVLVVVVAPREYRKFEDEHDEEDETHPVLITPGLIRTGGQMQLFNSIEGKMTMGRR
jgi:hypothetical protein